MSTIDRYSPVAAPGVAGNATPLFAASMQECAQMLSEFNLRNSTIQTDAANLLRDRDRMSAAQVKERAQVIANEIRRILELGAEILSGCEGVLPPAVLDRIEREMDALRGYGGTLGNMIRNASFEQLGNVLRGVVDTAGNILNGIGDFLENLPPIPIPMRFPERVM